MSNEFENNTVNDTQEVFSQDELEVLGEKLKNTESIEFPESLSQEEMAKKLSSATTVEVISPEKEKKNRRKIIFSAVAMAASFAIIVTSLLIIKPWEKPVIKAPTLIDHTPESDDDYTQIETLFKDYSVNYKAAIKEQQHSYKYGVFNKFAADLAAPEAAGDMNGTTGAKPGGTISVTQATGSSTGIVDESDGATNRGDSSHGETNEQVKGVSEADIIKNDGKYLYVVNSLDADWDSYYDELYDIHRDDEITVVFSTENGEETKETDTQPPSEATEKKNIKLKYNCAISIIEPQKDGKFGNISKINVVPDENLDIFYMYVQEMYIKGDKLIALVRCYMNSDETHSSTFKGGIVCDCVYPQINNTITMAVCYDITDRSNPVESWRVYQDGDYTSSRLVGDRLITVSNEYVDITADEETVIDNCVPKCGTSADDFNRIGVNDICIMENINDSRYIVVSTVDINDKNTLKSEAVLGGGQNVYCTENTLYATSTEYSANWGNAVREAVFGSATQSTKIYKFDISNGDIKFLCNGEVPGDMLNQFSMDEYNGYLRVATTSNTVDSFLSNGVYILDGNLKEVGKIDGIAKNERIKSVRFMGDTGYVVTFEQTDPLFVIDLKNPENPKILGELKIPGFSAYLHPVGDGLVLGVGVDGDDNGMGEGLKVSLFDVSDPENPVESDNIILSGYREARSWCYYSSEALYSHKALCYDEKENVMYIPYGKSATIVNPETNLAEDDITLGVLAVKVNEDSKKLLSNGEFKRNIDQTNGVFLYGRVTYIDNIIYAFTSDMTFATSFDKTTQMIVDEVELVSGQVDR